MMNMETKKLLLVLASLLVSLSVSAQKYTDDELDVAVRQAFKKTDVQWNNLKGNVVITRTKKLGFKKAYGEWVPGGTAPGEAPRHPVGTQRGGEGRECAAAVLGRL